MSIRRDIVDRIADEVYNAQTACKSVAECAALLRLACSIADIIEGQNATFNYDSFMQRCNGRGK